MESLERHKQLEMRPAVKEVPNAPPLSPSEKQELIELPKQLKHLNDRLAIVKKNVRRANDDGYMRGILSKFKQTRRGGYANLFSQRGLSLKIWMGMKPTPQMTILRMGAGRYRAQRLTHPDLEIIPQRMQSIRNRLTSSTRRRLVLLT